MISNGHRTQNVKNPKYFLPSLVSSDQVNVDNTQNTLEKMRKWEKFRMGEDAQILIVDENFTCRLVVTLFVVSTSRDGRDILNPVFFKIMSCKSCKSCFQSPLRQVFSLEDSTLPGFPPCTRHSWHQGSWLPWRLLVGCSASTSWSGCSCSSQHCRWRREVKRGWTNRLCLWRDPTCARSQELK